jgi:predicted MFS family arabinose efflux permease
LCNRAHSAIATTTGFSSDENGLSAIWELSSLRKYAHRTDVASRSKLGLLFSILHNRLVLLALTSTFFGQLLILVLMLLFIQFYSHAINFLINVLGLVVKIVGISSLVESLVGSRLAERWRTKKHQQLLGFWSFIVRTAVFRFVTVPQFFVSSAPLEWSLFF